MQKVLTAAEMREVDRLTTERYGVPSIILMENAAHAAARVITEKLDGSVKGKSFLILCGKGNNGGDGAALARLLWIDGAHVQVVLVGSIDELKSDAKTNLEMLRSLSTLAVAEREDPPGFISVSAEELDAFWVKQFSTGPAGTTVIVDALFGTGLTRKVEGALGLFLNSLYYAQEFDKEKGDEGFERDFFFVSLDIPSGLDSDLAGGTGYHLKSDLTISFTAPKPSNVLPPASQDNGELINVKIGSPVLLVDEQPSQLFLAESKDAREWLFLSGFSDDSYKNKRGHALLIAGSENYSGAAVMCGNAAIRSGVGLVTIGAPRSSKDSIAARVLPEVMVRPLAETENGAVSEGAIEEVEGIMRNVDAIAIGCGLSTDESSGKFVGHFVENRRVPTVLDADALTLLSPFPPNWPPAYAGGTDLILTPHEGEFLRMLGTDDKDAIKDRVAAVRDFAHKHNAILVLKGERVLIGEPGGKVVVNPTGNSGLGKAGNGDTLTGIIAGFTAQAAAMNLEMFETVVAAVYVAGLAGDIAEKKFGKRVMTASDVRDCLVEAFEVVG